MKLIHVGLVSLTLWLQVAQMSAQGLLVDQASGTLNDFIQNSVIIPATPTAQSFRPTLSAVGFVQLSDYINQASSGETLVINLRQGAYDGPIISSTTPVLVVNKLTQIGTFYFPGNVPVTPNQLYFFEPVLQSAGPMFIGYKDPSGYLNGNLWSNGQASPTGDLWFREGVVVVPEPASLCLLLLGAGAFLCLCRRCNQSQPVLAI